MLIHKPSGCLRLVPCREFYAVTSRTIPRLGISAGVDLLKSLKWRWAIFLEGRSVFSAPWNLPISLCIGTAPRGAGAGSDLIIMLSVFLGGK